MARSLADRQRAHEQSKARLAEQEAKLRLAERKARTRRLVEAGALAERAGLLGLPHDALYGALLSLRGGLDAPGQAERWAALGADAHERDARARGEGHAPFVLAFRTPLSREAAAALRAAGFRFSPVMRHWEGLATPTDAAALASAHGGSARRVGGEDVADGDGSSSASPADALEASAA